MNQTLRDGSTTLQSLIHIIRTCADGRTGTVVLHRDVTESVVIDDAFVTLVPYDEAVEVDGTVELRNGAEIAFDPDVAFVGRVRWA